MMRTLVAIIGIAMSQNSQVLPRIDPESIYADIAMLASDSMEGRRVGTAPMRGRAPPSGNLWLARRCDRWVSA
jgi:hypothetical protein